MLVRSQSTDEEYMKAEQHTATPIPVCPHCGETHDVTAENMPKSMPWWVVCPSCGDEYRVRINRDMSFTSEVKR
jgi:transposase-like protein